MGTRRRVSFSDHACVRMMERGITNVDVLQTLFNPAYEFPGNKPGTVESYGTTARGKALYVVTSRPRTRVITVVEIEET
jgi:Domain of unknown function (DUF4258)